MARAKARLPSQPDAGCIVAWTLSEVTTFEGWNVAHGARGRIKAELATVKLLMVESVDGKVTIGRAELVLLLSFPAPTRFCFNPKACWETTQWLSAAFPSLVLSSSPDPHHSEGVAMV